MRRLSHIVALFLLGMGLACAGGSAMNYAAADPIADARAALAKRDFYLVAVKLTDSIVSPIDSVYENTQINVEVGPSGGMRYLALAEDQDRPGVPSRAQMNYMKRFNTEMVRMIEANRPPRRS
jgi:hypothetical protein